MRSQELLLTEDVICNVISDPSFIPYFLQKTKGKIGREVEFERET